MVRNNFFLKTCQSICDDVCFQVLYLTYYNIITKAISTHKSGNSSQLLNVCNVLFTAKLVIQNDVKMHSECTKLSAMIIMC